MQYKIKEEYYMGIFDSILGGLKDVANSEISKRINERSKYK